MCEVTEKTCSKCKETKSVSLFNKNKSRKDGYDHSCRQCANEAWRDCIKNNPEKEKERNKKRNLNLNRKDFTKEWWKIQRHNLGDSYIKLAICQNTSLKFSEIPQELIECKRIQLQIQRHIKGLTQ